MSAFPRQEKLGCCDGGGGRGSSLSLWSAKDDVQEDRASEGEEKLVDDGGAKEGETKDCGEKVGSVENPVVSKQTEICCSDTDPGTDQHPTKVRSVAFEAVGGSRQGFEEFGKH